MIWAAGGIGASKLGGLNIKEWLQSRKGNPSWNRFDENGAGSRPW